MRPRHFLGMVILACCTLTTMAADTDWPGFRGAALDGKAEGRGTFRGKAAVDLETAWKTELGSGYSGIAVADGRAITAFAKGEHNLLAAFDSKTGKQLWQFELGPVYKGHDGSHDGPIATPYIHDGIVYMHDSSGLLIALQANDGTEVWRKQLVEEFEVPPMFYGYGSSPIVYDNKLIMIVGGKNQAVMAFNPKTGDVLWQEGSERVVYQSVMPWTYKDRQVLLAIGGKYLFALNPADGKPIWAWFHDGGGSPGSHTTLPIPLDESRIFMAHKTNHSTVVKLGEVKPAEVNASTEAAPEADGAAEQAAEPNYPLVEAEVVWEDMSIRKSYNIPILHEGHLYAYSTRFLTCVDPATGEAKWRSRPPGDGFLSFADGHLLILTKRGALHVVKATPEAYTPVAEINLFDDLAWTMPSFAEGAVFVRSMGHIARVNVVEASAVAASDTEAETEQSNSEFQALLTELRGLSDKAAKAERIDAFFEKHPQMPLIEADGRVNFLYYAAAEDIALASEIFGARQERGMQRVPDTDLFYYVANLPEDALVHYHFIKDFNDGLIDPRNPKQSETLTYDKFMGFNFSPEALPVSLVAMPKWQIHAAVAKAAATKAGKLTLHELDSKHLEGTQNIRVYTPRGYDENPDTRYPTLYVQNGNFVAENLYWSKVLPLVMGESVTPAIVVFVGDAPSFNPKFNTFLTEELVLFIDHNYRTKAEAKYRGNAGMGPAGLGAISATLSYPETFGFAGAHSPWVFDSSFPPMEEAMKKLGATKPKIYLDWGAYDMRNSQENWDTRKYAERFVELLKKYGVPVTVKTFNDGTGMSAWRHRSVPMLMEILAIER